MSAPVRTCVGCRTRAEQSALLRVAAVDGRLLPDAAAVLPGRGAWVHPAQQCVSAAVKRKAFGRALRAGSALDTADLVAFVERRA